MVIFLYGSDNFQAKEKLDTLKLKFLDKNNGNHFLISTIEGADFDLAEFRNKVLSSGFFAEKKMIVWKRKVKSEKVKIKEDEDEILKVIKRIPEEVTLIVWEQGEDEKFLKSNLGKFLLKQKYVFKFNSLFGNALVSWVRDRASSYGCAIDNEAALLVCDILGGDLWKIDLELNKICNYCNCGDSVSQGKVNKKVVEQMLVREAEESIFKFIDAIATKNKRLALLCLQNEFDAGANELSVLGMIARQIRILLQIKSMSTTPTKDSVAKDLGVHPYVAQKSLAQVKNFHINELKNIYRQLLQIDMSIKSSTLPARVMFDRMIAKM